MKQICIATLFAATAPSLGIAQMSWVADPMSGLHRVSPGIAYDWSRNVVVMFGGELGDLPPTLLVDTWEWDGSAWARVDDGTGPHPSARCECNVVFDPVRNATIVVGGVNPNQSGDLRTDCWTWDGSAWTRVADFPGSLTADRWADIKATFDPISLTVLAVAETFPFSAPVSRETFSWNGTNWSRVHAGVPDVDDLVHDVSLGRVVMPVGGVHHEWDGTTWSQVSVPSSPNLLRGQVDYDFGRGRMIRFGGSLNGPTFVQFNPTLYEFDGVAWVSNTSALTGREGCATTYDLAHQTWLMFGGRTLLTGPRSDMWTWDGSNASVVDCGFGPSYSFGSSSLAYDEARDKLVLYGGDDGVTWTRDAGVWSIAAIGGGPDAYGKMVYDTVSQRVLRLQWSPLTGATELWAWDGATWQLQPALQSPPQLSNLELAFDSHRGVLVVYGDNGLRGPTNANETWEWDGIRWTSQSPATGPGVLRDAAMAYDPRQRAVVLAGGMFTTGTALDFVWLWDGTNWTRSSERIMPRANAQMVYDRTRERLVLHGGQDDQSLRNETFEWTGTGPWVERARVGSTLGGGSASGMVSANDVHAFLAGRFLTYEATTAPSSTLLTGGCGLGANPAPTLTPNRLSLVSTPDFGLEIDGFSPHGTGFFGLSFVAGPGISLGPCRLHLLGPWAVTAPLLADATGRAVQPLAITTATAPGLTFTVQSGELVAGGPLLSLLTLSNGYTFSVGD